MNNSPMNSLRARLLAMLLAVTGLIWLAAAVWNYRDARHEAEEMLDAQLAQSARLLLAQTRHEIVDEGDIRVATTEALDERELHPYEQKLAFRIKNPQGQILLASATSMPAVPATTRGYDAIHSGEQGWRVLVVEDSDLRIEVAQSLAIRDELARNVAQHLAVPVLLVLPLLGGLILFVVGRALRPLDTLADTVAARTPSNLAALENHGLPSEVQPLVNALNSLLGRLGHALENERRFTADAAHELRTPLAGIQVQAQVALASQSADSRIHAMQQVLTGTQRATRLVEQLLRLARLDPLAGLPESVNINLADLARQTVEELRLAPDRLQLELAEDAIIAGDPDLLRVALRNLIDNALRHAGGDAPNAAPIMLGVDHDPHGVRLRVEDCGPGVPTAELSLLSQRFYRGEGVAREGSGLGLAIVARIAQLHGARLSLENRAQGGLRALLEWPPHY